MGSSPVTQSSTTQVNQTTTPTATPEETELNKLRLEQNKAYASSQTDMYKNAFGLGNQLLTSFGDKSGSQWQSLIGGVTPAQMQAQAMQAGRLTNASLNQAGLVDSGVGKVMNARAMSDSMNSNAQFNVGAQQNALNLALSGQAQVQAPAQGNTNSLASSLAGLRSTQTTGQNIMGGKTVTPWQGANLGIFGTWGGSYCWVAAEIFGGWDNEKTCMVRYYIGELAPKWFKNFYLKYGERIAKFIHNKPVFKAMLRPLFECFVLQTKKEITNEISIRYV
jgi:hypothetical protein